MPPLHSPPLSYSPPHVGTWAYSVNNSVVIRVNLNTAFLTLHLHAWRQTTTAQPEQRYSSQVSLNMNSCYMLDFSSFLWDSFLWTNNRPRPFSTFNRESKWLSLMILITSNSSLMHGRTLKTDFYPICIMQYSQIQCFQNIMCYDINSNSVTGVQRDSALNKCLVV